MIRNDYTPEEAHVTNWLLYSGAFNPGEAFDRARAKAAHCDGEDVEEATLDALTEIVEDSFALALGEAMPETDGTGEIYSDFRPTAQGYSGMPASALILSLLAPARSQIDFACIAQLIAEHVDQQRKQPIILRLHEGQHELN